MIHSRPKYIMRVFIYVCAQIELICVYVYRAIPQYQFALHLRFCVADVGRRINVKTIVLGCRGSGV